MFAVQLQTVKAITQTISLDRNMTLCIRREDLIHPQISGNKWRKLKYNLLQAEAEGQDCLLTFGGAFSNHIAAVAAVGAEFGFKTIGIIRGEELALKIGENPTLSFAAGCGMTLEFVSRDEYRDKENSAFIAELHKKFGAFYLLPEGGTNALAVKGCEEILTADDAAFDYICSATGTGGTIAGLVNSSLEHQKILGFPALKGDFPQDDIQKLVTRNNWQLISDYHFGGYGKIDAQLVHFINRFYRQTQIPLDPIYTAKMVFGVMDLVEKGFFPDGSKVLLIHTGGIQGIAGMNIRLNNKKLPLIQIND